MKIIAHFPHYETSCDTSHLPASFNTPIHMHHIESLEKEALLVIQEWEASL